ncbi:MAG: helix-turn-helix domain-containing protein [Pseudonocardiaceae bacterium]
MTDEPDKSGDSCLVERDTTEGDRARWVAALTADLRRMHQEAGKPSLRQMAMKVPYSHTALSDALRGRRGRLPSQDLTLALVRACGGDEQAWQARWHQEHARIVAHATSRDRGLSATDAVSHEVDVRPSPQRPRRPLLLSALGVSLAVVIGGVVLAVSHGVGTTPPIYGLGGAQPTVPTCEQNGSYDPCRIQQLADQIPKAETAPQMKERIAEFSQGPPRSSGPWPFFIYDTIITKDDIGVVEGAKPADIREDWGVLVRTTPVKIGQKEGTMYLKAVVWADCYVSNTFHPGVPKNDDVGAKWLRIHYWPTGPLPTDPALSSPTEPFIGYVYAGYALPFTHNGQIPSCARP